MDKGRNSNREKGTTESCGTECEYQNCKKLEKVNGNTRRNLSEKRKGNKDSRLNNTVNNIMNNRYSIYIRNVNDINNDNMNGNLKKRIQNGDQPQLRNVRRQNKGRNIGKENKERPENPQGKDIIEIEYININVLNIISTIDLDFRKKRAKNWSWKL